VTSAPGLVKASLLAGGWYSRRLKADTLPGVLVLCYHGIRAAATPAENLPFANLHVDAETFESHCRVVAETCHPIALDDWRAARRGLRPLPNRPVLITFDDGYRSVYELARPILKRLAIPAVMFVCSAPIRRQELFWFDAAARSEGESAVAERIERDPPGASQSFQTAAGAGDPLAPMTSAQVAELADDGFEIGVHTATHAPLGRLSQASQRHELQSCRDALVEWTGAPVRALAYPWGRAGIDYTDETMRIAAEVGFDTAFTTQPQFATADAPPLECPRFLVLSEVEPAELAHRIAYAWR